MKLLFVDPSEGFDHHIAASIKPFVLQFEQQRADQKHDQCMPREDAHDVGATFFFFIQALVPLRAAQPGSILARAGQVGQYIMFGGRTSGQPCPHHHLSVCRGSHHRRQGRHHPRPYRLTWCAFNMRMTAV